MCGSAACVSVSFWLRNLLDAELRLSQRKKVTTQNQQTEFIETSAYDAAGITTVRLRFSLVFLSSYFLLLFFIFLIDFVIVFVWLSFVLCPSSIHAERVPPKPYVSECFHCLCPASYTKYESLFLSHDTTLIYEQKCRKSSTSDNWLCRMKANIHYYNLLTLCLHRQCQQ